MHTFALYRALRTKAKDADEARILSSNESRRATLSRGITLANAAPSISLVLPSRRRFLSKAPITRLNAPSSPRSLLHTYYASFVRDRHATPSSRNLRRNWKTAPKDAVSKPVLSKDRD